MAQVRKASKVQCRIQMLTFGAPFSGKSTLSLSAAKLKNPDGTPFKILYLDAEQGGSDFQMEELERQGVNLDNILMVYTQSLAEVKQYIQMASKRLPLHEFDEDGVETDDYIIDGQGKPFVVDCIVLDGSSVLKMVSTQSLLELSRKRARIKATARGLTGDEKFVATTNAQLELRDYNALNYDAASLILDLAASNCHWIVTAREKPETIQREINGKSETINTGNWTFDGFKNMDYNCSTVVRMFREKDEQDIVKMEVIKDRTKTFIPGEIVDDPSLLIYQDMINKTSNRETFAVKNTMQEAVSREGSLFEKALGVASDDKEETPAPASKNSDTEVDLKALADNIVSRREVLTDDARDAFKSALKKAGLPISIKKADKDALIAISELLKKYE